MADIYVDRDVDDINDQSIFREPNPQGKETLLAVPALH